MALSKKNRLTTQDFSKIKNKSGLWSKGLFLKVKSVKNNLLESRFGIVVGSNISKKAVLRNKIKRILREVINKNINNIKKGFDIIIIVNPQAAGKNYKEFESDIIEALNNIKLLIKQ